MPSHMICGVMLTMWAWRMWRRFTTSVICMREPELIGLHLTAKMDTWEVSMSARTAAGILVSGRGARSSSTKPFQRQPHDSSSCAMEAAMASVARSAISVTFSSGWMRRQVMTAERAPGANSAGKSSESRWAAVSSMDASKSPVKRNRNSDAYSERLTELS